MRTPFVALTALALLGAAALPASAKSDKKGPPLRYQHTYAGAIEEAKERNCVVFVSIHAEH